jgi:hypothetical protein
MWEGCATPWTIGFKRFQELFATLGTISRSELICLERGIWFFFVSLETPTEKWREKEENKERESGNYEKQKDHEDCEKDANDADQHHAVHNHHLATKLSTVTGVLGGFPHVLRFD